RSLPILPSPRTDHYRLRTQFNVRASGGKQRIGFFRQGSYDLIEVDDAFLIDPLINRTLKAIRSLEPQLPSLKEIHINATPTAQVHILFLSEQGTLPRPDALFAGLKKAIPEVIGITVFANRKKTFALGDNRLSLESEGL